MQTAPEDVRRLASALVDLGNSSATTESEILEMALRIAGAGRTIGLSEQQVLGFAAALSSVGIRAEAGGTAISRVFLEIDSAVSRSGDNLDAFAEVAGVSAQQFAEAYRRDAGQAIAAFIAGLGRVQRTGGDVNQVLDRLGLTEIRVSDALRRIAGAGDLLNKTLEISNRAWDENEALTAEAERRYGTVEARLQIARNQLNDFAISIGQNMLPVLGDMVDKAGALLSVLGELPSPVRTAITVVAALGAAITLAGGAALIAVPRIAAFRAALDTLENSGGRAATAVRGFRRVLGGIPWGPVGVAAGVLTVAIGVFAAKQAEARQRVEEVSETLNQQTGALTDNTRAWVAHKLEQDGVLKRAEQLGLDLATVTDAVMGDAAATAELNRVLDDNEITTLDAARAAEEYRQRLLEQGVSSREAALQTTLYHMELKAQARASRETGGAVDQLRNDIEKAQAATRRQAEATGQAAGQTERLTPQMQHLAEVFGVSAGEAEGLNDELREMDERLRTLFDSAFAVDEAQDAVTEGMRRLIEHAKEEGGALEGNSEAALRNRDNLRDLIREHGNYISELIKSGASQETVRRENEDFIRSLERQAKQVGINRDELDPYIEVLEAIPETVATSVELDTAAANAALDRFNQKLRALPGFGGAEVRHSGGLVGFGAFTRPRHDEVPVILQRGEFVSTRAAT
ncbi:MAG TPA: phage tail tape measure protein, partial [Micromonosporaceae bacterium]|nr:phage tail tape measure protein [Micromonosporaceae bacterium]